MNTVSEEVPVTVLMPVYNAEKFVAEAIDGILNQTFKNFELLIVNDGSTDNSVTIIESYVDSRIKLIHNSENLGLINTLNKGIQLIKSKYIVRADADDICLKHRLEKQFQFMETNPDVDICGTWFDNFNTEGITVGGRYSQDDYTIKLKQLHQIHLCHGTSIIRSIIFKDLGLSFDIDYWHAEDYELFDRISENSVMANVPEVLYLVRSHDTQVSLKFSKTQNQNTARVRLRALQRVAKKTSQKDADIYEHLMHQQYHIHENDAVLAVLELLFDGNSESQRFNEEKFRQHLSRLYYHFCTANRSKLKSNLLSSIKTATFFTFSDLNFAEKYKVIHRTVF